MEEISSLEKSIVTCSDSSQNLKSSFPQITEEMKEAVEQFLIKIEKKYNIQIFYACDTGSRSMGVAAESSDFDINGFFKVINQEDEKKFKKVLSKDHVKDLIDPLDKFAEMYDIQIWDINRWIEKKFKENINSCDFWFYSPIIYRNTLPELFSDMKLKVSPPTSHFWGKFMNNYRLYKERITKGVEHKKIMNIIIYGLWFLHCKIFKSFPTFNVFLEIEFLKNSQDIIKNYFDDNEYKDLEKCYDYIFLTYEEKKKNKKSLAYALPDFLINFVLCIKTKNFRIMKNNNIDEKIEEIENKLESIILNN